MSSNPDKAVEIFNQGFSCSQAVLVSYCEKFGLDRDTALKISTGFGGGMHLGQTCGAVTGAIMAIGLKFGRYRSEDRPAKITTYEYVEKFAQKFKARHGSLACKDLIGCDITTTEGMQHAKDNDLFKTVCVDLVKTATEILDEIL